MPHGIQTHFTSDLSKLGNHEQDLDYFDLSRYGRTMNKKAFLKHNTSRYFTSRNLSLQDPDRDATLLGSLAGVDRLVFLDIDGVLNTSETYWRFKTQDQCVPFVGVDRDLVAILNQISDDCVFVLSSTWRDMYYDTLQYLAYQGFKGKVIGKTILPDLHRGNDILHWVKKHDCQGKWLAIDDDTTCSVLGDHWIQTHDGITQDHIHRIQGIFHAPYP